MPARMSTVTATLNAAATSPRDLRAWNQTLNRTHAMAGMRARAGWVVRAIEERRRAWVARTVRRLHPSLVVDIGCEDGWMAEAYAADVGRLVLSDLDGEVLRDAVVAERANVETVVSDALAPHALRAHLGHARADLIVLSALLEHVPDPGRALRALSPLLADGGRFVLYVPADRPILFLKSVLKRMRLGGLVRGLSLEPAPGHLHVFDRSNFAGVLRPFGEIEQLAFDPLCLGYVAVLRPNRRDD